MAHDQRTVNPETLRALAEAAAAATDQWEHEGEWTTAEGAAFVSAASPAAILDLLARLRGAEEERDEALRLANEAVADHMGTLGALQRVLGQRDALVAVLRKRPCVQDDAWITLVRDTLARIRAEGPEPGPARDELAHVLAEATARRSPEGCGGMTHDPECWFCGGTKRPDPEPGDEDGGFLHFRDCAWIAARSLLARMGPTPKEPSSPTPPTLEELAEALEQLTRVYMMGTALGDHGVRAVNVLARMGRAVGG